MRLAPRETRKDVSKTLHPQVTGTKRILQTSLFGKWGRYCIWRSVGCGRPAGWHERGCV